MVSGKIPFDPREVEFLVAGTDDEDGVDVCCDDLWFDFLAGRFAIEQGLSLEPLEGTVVFGAEEEPVADGDFAGRLCELDGDAEFAGRADEEDLAAEVGGDSGDDERRERFRSDLLLEEGLPADGTKLVVVHSTRSLLVWRDPCGSKTRRRTARFALWGGYCFMVFCLTAFSNADP